MSAALLEGLLANKATGNECYKAKDYEGAIAAYAKAVANLPTFGDDSEDEEDATPPEASDPEVLKQGAVVLCNRAACYMALNKAIPALADAQRAAHFDPSNWKAHWRTGVSLMLMKPRLERSEQAIAAFERTLKCESLPESEQSNAKEALNRAKYRLEQGKDALDMPVSHATLLSSPLSFFSRRLARAPPGLLACGSLLSAPVLSE